LINLEFFKWLHDEYGMILDIYVISAGAIDKGSWYGSMDSDEFRAQFPNGFEPIYRKAKEMGTRLVTWGGPDGFGNTPAEEQARIDMIVRLCKDYEFRLLKFDAVVGQLRDEKQDAFIKMMTECRKYSPDLILLNHRLNLGEEAEKHATTSLWGGEETYIDVHMPNKKLTAPHHRASAISRDVVPGLKRLTEDHGVCLSSCLDYWEDDLILQAFNRSLLLSPQLYGNPWFLKDEEFPKLARIFNLARQYGDIMVDGMVLPEENYGENAVSRGNEETRLITLRNLSWDQKSFRLNISEEIGLDREQPYEVLVLHPVERIVGEFSLGKAIHIDELIVDTEDEHGLQPWKFGEAAYMEVSDDLKNWERIPVLAGPVMKAKLDANIPVRYVRFRGTPDKIVEVKGFLNGTEINRDGWRGSNLFSPYSRFKAETAWSSSTIIDEIHPGTYLAVALEGVHGIEGAYAAIRVDGTPVGASDRSPSYPCNPWEYPVQGTDSHYTYYIPLTKEMEGRKLDIVVLGMKGGMKDFKPNAYLTCHPVPYQKLELKLYR
jgi:hypothetical protein